MRCIFIKLGARRRRRQHQKQIQDLTHKIDTLETQNKQNPTPQSSNQQTQLRYDLRLFLLGEFEKSTRRLKNNYYAHGNKAGKLLTQCL